MLTNDDEEVCAAIEAVRGRLVDGVLADMYPNPFWDDRYGARGRALCQEDNHHHLNYLIAAIRTAAPDTMAAYYKWLQVLLVSRGMCTYHIRQNMDRMEAHLHALLPEAWPAIELYHQAGYRGLAYAQPACQALAAHAAQIAEATTTRRYAADPFWEQQFGPRGRALCQEDNLYHLSYLGRRVIFTGCAVLAPARCRAGCRHPAGIHDLLCGLPEPVRSGNCSRYTQADQSGAAALLHGACGARSGWRDARESLRRRMVGGLRAGISVSTRSKIDVSTRAYR
jgi:hypothetical protein